MRRMVRRAWIREARTAVPTIQQPFCGQSHPQPHIVTGLTVTVSGSGTGPRPAPKGPKSVVRSAVDRPNDRPAAKLAKVASCTAVVRSRALSVYDGRLVLCAGGGGDQRSVR